MLRTRQLCKKGRERESTQSTKRKRFKRQKAREYQSAATALPLVDTEPSFLTESLSVPQKLPFIKPCAIIQDCAIHLCFPIHVFAMKLCYSSASLPATQPKPPHRHTRMS